MEAVIGLPLRIGTRTLWRLRRRLVRVPHSLAMGLAGAAAPLPALPPSAHGYWITALPAVRLADVGGTDLRPFVRQAYRRHYAMLTGSFDAYLAGFSARSRATLKRKQRRLAERSGGAIDCRRYRAPAEMAEFHRLARQVSRTSYQERLLDAGLPDGPEMLAAMTGLARDDAVRGWILFLDGAPVSYLYAPADGDTLLYAHLGYDPAFADLSPGTILQLEAMRGLMEEGRFRLFDFTEGEGRHKSQFGTGTIDCVDLLLLRPTVANRLLGHGLGLFDTAVDRARRAVSALGLERLARRALR